MAPSVYQKLKRLSLALLMLMMFSGCSVFKASPLRATSFLPVREKLDESASSGPFQGLLYLNQEKFFVLNAKNTYWYVAPVDTKALNDMVLQSSDSARKKQSRLEEIAEIARYTKAAFEKVLSSNEIMPLTVGEKPHKRGLTLELALVEVEPTSPLINTIGTIAGFFIPGGSLINLLGSGSVAIEGFVRDARTHEILVEFKDREKDKLAPFTVKDFQRYAHLRVAIQEWAVIFAEFITSNGMKEISPPSPFTLNPL